MKKILFPALAALALTACSDGKPDNKLFEKTINRIAEKQGVCLPLILNVQHPQANAAFSQTFLGAPEIRLAEKDQNGKAINQTAIKQMDLMEDEDFYEQSDIEMPAPGGKTVSGRRYTLTDEGKERVRTTRPDTPDFCIGRLKVKKINWFTEPSPANGMTVSRVSYQAEFIPENWLEDLIKAGGGKMPLESEQSETATLVKTGDGWQDAAAVKQQ
ncbi:lipoprotein [Neisseria chenwenguii]|uniref:Type IV secretion system putative lipoprotein virB7 n=1 Tax=Neisseria chenwenguii TaxID=1853278 RepID=A0A220RYT4_9NEIS|nr:lipoprotein [Neisseria chenwenguii]ASK26369.1 hypothetical protein BG910_00170 [Neisseria chenwenguii]ROV55791.1 hypothetical protein EGS38_07660 [Neisseria chenwenguii]